MLRVDEHFSQPPSAPESESGSMHVYAGIFLVAFASLAIEITLVRLLSVTTWYHLAYFAVSTAMLGATAGATRVYLAPEQYTKERFSAAAAKA